MKKIITISREFGSGGHELGRLLADEMKLPIYDHEIIELLAKENNLCSEYEGLCSEKTLQIQYAATVANRFTANYSASERQLKLISAQETLIKKFAEHDCIIVGRAADILLASENPFNIFVYADMQTKIDRCISRTKPDEHFTEKELAAKIKRITHERANYHALFSDLPWGRKESYTLCLNTSGCDLKVFAKPLALYINAWLEEKK